MIVNCYQETGAYHLSERQDCQDALSFWENEQYALGVISDGVSACKYAKVGAELTCKAVEDFVKLEGDNLFQYSAEKVAYLMIEHILYFIEKEASRHNHDFREYASTVAFSLTEKKTGKTLLGNLGDGAILLFRDETDPQILLEPKRIGQQPCLTTTKDSYKFLQLQQVSLPLCATVFLCTDGMLHALKSLPTAPDLHTPPFDALNSALNECFEPDDYSYIALTQPR